MTLFKNVLIGLLLASIFCLFILINNKSKNENCHDLVVGSVIKLGTICS